MSSKEKFISLAIFSVICSLPFDFFFNTQNIHLVTNPLSTIFGLMAVYFVFFSKRKRRSYGSSSGYTDERFEIKQNRPKEIKKEFEKAVN